MGSSAECSAALPCLLVHTTSHFCYTRPAHGLVISTFKSPPARRARSNNTSMITFCDRGLGVTSAQNFGVRGDTLYAGSRVAEQEHSTPISLKTWASIAALQGIKGTPRTRALSKLRMCQQRSVTCSRTVSVRHSAPHKVRERARTTWIAGDADLIDCPAH